jgi:hypothetical protein
MLTNRENSRLKIKKENLKIFSENENVRDGKE